MDNKIDMFGRYINENPSNSGFDIDKCVKY